MSVHGRDLLVDSKAGQVEEGYLEVGSGVEGLLAAGAKVLAVQAYVKGDSRQQRGAIMLRQGILLDLEADWVEES